MDARPTIALIGSPRNPEEAKRETSLDFAG
jgi:hypothetical protein